MLRWGVRQENLWEPETQRSRYHPSDDEVRRATTQPLVDEILRETYKDRGGLATRFFPRSACELRQLLTSSQRFILDDDMSAFIADLSMSRMIRTEDIPDLKARDKATDKNMEIVKSMRHSAIPPGETVWVEMKCRPLMQRLVDLRDGNARDMYGEKIEPDDCVYRMGWLFSHDPSIHTVCLYVFGIAEGGEAQGIIPFCLPFSFIYNYADKPMEEFPFGPDTAFQIDHKAAMLGHSLARLDPCMGVINHVPLDKLEAIPIELGSGDHVYRFKAHTLLVEFTGTLRRAMAFLATLSSIPKVEAPAPLGRSYMAKGKIRKALPCTSYRLSLPSRKTPERLAKDLVETMHKRWHAVRPHWRVYEPEGKTLCPNRSEHLWSAMDNLGRSRCTQCEARRTWIVLPNGRGDPSLGTVVRSETTVTARKPDADPPV